LAYESSVGSTSARFVQAEDDDVLKGRGQEKGLVDQHGYARCLEGGYDCVVVDPQVMVSENRENAKRGPQRT